MNLIQMHKLKYSINNLINKIKNIKDLVLNYWNLLKNYQMKIRLTFLQIKKSKYYPKNEKLN
jgi:hypothetical protein